MSTASRVLKNTTFLYLKMGLTFILTLYTTRLILKSLGASDYGIFNLIGSSIAMLGFLNSTMTNATLRFMAYSEGNGNIEYKKKIFNVSFAFHLIISIVTLLLFICVMHSLFNNVLNIPENRIFAAKIVYYSLMISTAITIISVPYDAIINAHENMLYYSILRIIESLLKLTIAIICIYVKYDKLIIYGILMATIPLITFIILRNYCIKHYEECHISLKSNWDKNIVKQIITFSSWNFLTSISSLFSMQGIGLVLNHFFGPVLNATQGIANQLNSQLCAFSGNMMKALNPVIIKKAGANNIQSMINSTLTGCKFSTYLLIVFAIPFMLEISFILKIWLVNMPLWTSTFCILLLIQTIICQMSSGVATIVYAQGNIKRYAIYKSIMNILPIFVVFFCFKWGCKPYCLYIPMILFWAIGGNIVILKFAKEKCTFPIRKYLIEVILPILIVSSAMLASGYVVINSFHEGWLRLSLSCIATTISMIISIYTFGITNTEKQQIRDILIKRNSSKNIQENI